MINGVLPDTKTAAQIFLLLYIHVSGNSHQAVSNYFSGVASEDS
jgi:hypothetical protein